MESHEGTTGFLNQINREEAFLLFDKLKSSSATVWCGGDLYGWSFRLNGRVEDLSPSLVTLVSLDGEASLSVWLDRDDLSFWYAEPSAFPKEFRDSFPQMPSDSVLIGVLLPLEVRSSGLNSGDVVKRDKLIFAELKEEGEGTG